LTTKFQTEQQRAEALKFPSQNSQLSSLKPWLDLVFTAQCTLVQSAVLLSLCCLSVSLS